MNDAADLEREGMIKLLSTPIRSLLRFPLFRFAFAVTRRLY
jgi:hypothetical protein